MPVILAAVLLSVAIAAAAGAGYYAGQEAVYQRQPMPSVRVGDPGSNLVGSDWSGNPGPRRGG
jgi:hypothetical protein